jgi:BirA family transcriptional regulator, biotin operon repressor / biotin---[acetyl-CoA-carboxylase] ligase
LAMVTSQNIDRDLLLSNVITKLRGIYQGFVAAEGNAEASGVRPELIGLSATIGQEVSIEFPDGKKANGKAMDIDQTGRLVVQTQTETLKVAAGDVLHLRPAARENS